MAALQFEDGTICTNFSEIADKLTPLNVQIERLPEVSKPYIQELLGLDILSLAEKEEILSAYDHYFVQFQSIAGYQWRDLTVMHPGSPYLEKLIALFDRCHTHQDDEALLILTGECIFGFVLPDTSQVELTMQAQEYLNIPSGTEHWFRPTGLLHLKAVRYFTTIGGWTPEYTNTQIQFHNLLQNK